MSLEVDPNHIIQMGLNTAIAFCRAMAVDQLLYEGTIAVVAELIDPILNVVIDTQTTDSKLEEHIATVFSFYQRHQAQWCWIVSPLSKPSSLPDYLKRHGLICH